jgi:hypothetical protein
MQRLRRLRSQCRRLAKGMRFVQKNHHRDSPVKLFTEFKQESIFVLFFYVEFRHLARAVDQRLDLSNKRAKQKMRIKEVTIS